MAYAANEQTGVWYASCWEKRSEGGPLLSLDLAMFEGELDQHAIAIKAVVHPFESPRPIADVVAM